MRHRIDEEISIAPCTEGKPMNHLEFKNKSIGRLVAKFLMNHTPEVEVHRGGEVICMPTDLREVDLGALIGRAKHIYRQMGRLNDSIRRRYKVKQALWIVRRATELFPNKLAIAFSGGKDSLVSLHLALKVDRDIPVIYNNTTIEFPETLRYVKELAREWGFELLVSSPERSFWDAVRERGWATHENRWCCVPYKEEPALKLMLERQVEAEVTGTVRTESIYRRSLVPFRLPSKSPYLIRVNPIYDWNEWEVWSYISENGLPYNPLYDMGYRRIGCWCCPLNGPSHYLRLRKTHPKLFSFLQGFTPRHPVLGKLMEH